MEDVKTTTLSPAPGTIGAVPICRHYGRTRYESAAAAVAVAKRLAAAQRAVDPVVACSGHYHVIVTPRS